MGVIRYAPAAGTRKYGSAKTMNEVQEVTRSNMKLGNGEELNGLVSAIKDSNYKERNDRE